MLRSGGQVASDEQNWSTQVTGTTPDYFIIRNWKISRGTGFTLPHSGARVHVPDCVRLTPEKLETLDWLPDSCAYLRLQRGQGLADWHPLISGDPESVHRAGISVRGWTVSEDDAGDLAAGGAVELSLRW